MRPFALTFMGSVKYTIGDGHGGAFDRDLLGSAAYDPPKLALSPIEGGRPVLVSHHFNSLFENFDRE